MIRCESGIRSFFSENMNLIEPVVSEEFADIHTHIQRAYGYYNIDVQGSRILKESSRNFVVKAPQT